MNMKKFFAKKEKQKKGKTLLGILGGTGAIAALAPAAGAAPIDFTNQTLDVSVTDVVATGFNFANMFNDYTLIVLGVIFAPILIGFVIWLFGKIKAKSVGVKG